MTNLIKSLSSWVEWLYVGLASDRRTDWLYLAFWIVVETGLSLFIVERVSYTEIDWEAYMQEVEEWWINGQYDYREIRGSTGPLVYPAGFLYLYALLRHATGQDIRRAQHIFVLFYVSFIAVALYIYQCVMRRRINGRATVHTVWYWRIAMALLCLSKRLHSIFVLRLFNDGPAMLLLFVSVALFSHNRWRLGCVFFSLAVSIKMNILLFAPGLLLLLLQAHESLWGTLVCLSICAAIQLFLGAPFLLRYPVSYLRKAFELDRVFLYKWTVNWKFLPEDVFVSKPLSVLLLFCHVGTLAYLAVQWSSKRIKRSLTPEYIVYTLFLSNFVGICFARTLHYQFYSWYASTIPMLLWLQTPRMLLPNLVLVGALEYAFHVYPATPTSSMVLQATHLIILARMKSPHTIGMEQQNKQD